MEEKQSWTIVLFIEDKSVEAVPSHWIQGDICHWPPYTSDKLMHAIKKCELLNTCWPTHPVKIFRNASFDDYGKARLKTRLAEETSDLNSDVDHQCRRKRAKKMLSSSDESDVSETILPSPPRQKKNKTQDISRNINKVLDIPNSTALVLNADPITLNDSENPACKTCSEKDKYLKTLSEQLHIVRGLSVDILSELRDMKKQIQTGNTETQSVTFSMKFADTLFPITSDDQFNSLEKILENTDDMQLLVEQLSKIGGTSCYHFVKRVLSTCLTNEMALKYSWLGRKGKKSFSKLNMAKVVICRCSGEN
ncbi:hypothetical protein FQR65_LT19314 [Abscondita terminalis]|nr:hypothetical protein FQR65_LT19314 [Abscondita terminalis]